jgi:hypothetical protein
MVVNRVETEEQEQAVHGPPEVRGPRAPNCPVVRGKRHRVGTGSGDDQAVSRITVKRRRERIEGEHHLDAEWHHGNHPGIGPSREPILEGQGQIEPLPGVQCLHFPEADRRNEKLLPTRLRIERLALGSR